MAVGPAECQGRWFFLVKLASWSQEILERGPELPAKLRFLLMADFLLQWNVCQNPAAFPNAFPPDVCLGTGATISF